MRTITRLAALLVAGLVAPRALAADCAPRTHVSPCIDADPLWVPATPTPFVGLPSARALPAGTFALALHLSNATRPVTVVAASPDPAGREVLVVDQLVGGAIAAAYSPRPHLETTVAVPFVAYRDGTGVSGITSQNGSSLASPALGDVRVGIAHDLYGTANGAAPRVDLLSRLELAFPTGGDLSGSRGATVAPSFGLGLHAGRFSIGALVGARLRAVAELGETRLGSQLVTMLGAAVDVLNQGLLSFALEAFALPSLVSQRGALPDGTPVVGTLIPAEWLLSAKTRAGPVILQLGGGTAIPLSGITREAPGQAAETEHFAAMTSPEYRLVLVARWVTN